MREAGRRRGARDRRQRVELARGVGRQPHGRRLVLELLGQQDELVEAVAAAGKPTVAVLHRRPAARRSDASPRRVPALLVEAGTSARRAAQPSAEALFGEIEPGRQAADQLPALRRPAAGLLQPQADVPPPLQRQPARAALRCSAQGLRYTTLPLDDVKVTPAAIRCPGAHRHRARDEHRQPRGRRGGAAVRSRHGQPR